MHRSAECRFHGVPPCLQIRPTLDSPPGAGSCTPQAAKCRDGPRYKLPDSMKTAAFVPIRLNSQRVSGKNLRPLSGSPLMCHILRTLTEVEGIDEVYVYCSDERHPRIPAPKGCGSCAAAPALDRDTTLGTGDLRQLHRRGRGRPLRAGARHLAVHPRRDRRGCASESAFGRSTTRRSAPKRSRPSPGSKAGRSTMRSTTSPARRPSSRSISKPAHSSSSRGRLWTGRHAQDRRQALHGCRGPHRGAGHRQPRGFHDGRDHRGQAGGLVVTGSAR